MTLVITHGFVETVPEDPASGVPGGPVGPSEWNANHTLTGLVSVAQGGNGIGSGTSGGVLYFSGSTTVASSGALTSGGVVIGGGAGSAPFTDSGLSYSGTGATGTLTIGGQAAVSSDAANIFAHRNSTNAQDLRVYNTFTDSTHFEAGEFAWQPTSNVLSIGTISGSGGGNVRNLQFVIGGVDKLDFGIQSANRWATGVGVTGFGTGTASGSTGEISLWDGTAGFSGNRAVSLTNGFFASVPAVGLAASGVFGWDSGTSVGSGGIDTGITRIAPVSSVSTIAIGNGTAGDASATIKAKTKSGAPTASDVPAGTWVLIRDTLNSTTKIYYNNGGTLQVIALA